MLDVHPPHAPTHTWRDFLIHIATIVVGLLIAVGLEQSVEWLHHRSEVRETRKLLAEERAQNVSNFHIHVVQNRFAVAHLENDLRIFLYLQQHPGTPLDKLPGVPFWYFVETPYAHASWVSAGQANVLTLMSRTEVEESRNLYQWLAKDEDKQSALSDAFNKARAYTYIQPDLSKLTRAQVEAELPLIQDCLRLTADDMSALLKIAEDHIDFSPGPSSAEIRSALRITSNEPSKDFPAAYAFTQHDMDNARALEKADEPAIEFAKEFTEQGPGHLQDAYEKIHARYPDFKPEENRVAEWGYATMSNGDLPRAIEFFQFDLKLYPDSWNGYYYLGEAYAKAGKKKLAIENYQHAHQLNPTAASPIAALKELQK